MAVIYLNKSGNDANDGLSRANAKLTLASANTAAGSGGTIYIGTGIWKEPQLSIGGSRTITFIADGGFGTVIMDGDNTEASCVTAAFLALNATMSGLVFRNYTSAAVINNGNTCVGYWTNCLIENCNKGVDVANASPQTHTFINTVFALNATGLNLAVVSASVTVVIKNCTFVGNTIACIKFTTGAATSATNQWMNNIFSDSPDLILASGMTDAAYAGQFLGGTRIVHDFNCYHLGSGTNMLRTSTASRTTLGGVQTVTGNDEGSIAADPLFVSTTNLCFSLKPTSPCAGTGFNGADIGAMPTAFGISNTLNSSYWTNAVLTNLEIDGGGNIVLSVGQTEGTAALDVVDMGTSRTMRRVIPFGNYDGVNAFDFDETGTAPNRWTLEVRASDTVFAKDAGAPAWVEKEWGTVLAGVAGRYQQVRVTVRNDDVEA